VGLSFNTQIGQNIDDNIFVGAAYHHFNRSAKMSFYGNNDVQILPKVVVSGGVRMGVTDYSFVTFHADYSKQGTSTETIGGMLYSLKLDDPEEPRYILHGGAFIRWKDALIPVIQMEYKPMTIALSYDVNVSQLKAASQGRGGFELAVTYQKYFDRDNSSKEKVLCPRF
jgi:hypothetical protein